MTHPPRPLPPDMGDESNVNLRLKCLELAINMHAKSVQGFYPHGDVLSTILNADILMQYAQNGQLPINNGVDVPLDDIFKSVLEQAVKKIDKA